jgi:hypothetical protein
MLKKFILLIAVFLIISPCFAAVQDNSSYLSSVELKLFGTKFAKETITKRLDRIEKDVFGIKSSGTQTVRIAKLKTVFKPTSSQIVKKAPVKKKNITPVKQIKQNPAPNIKYTMVDEIEKKVLKKTFSNEDIERRLSRLETIVYGGSVNASLNSRVDNLKTTVFKNNQSTAEQSYSATQLNSDSVNMLLSKMERDVFNQVYSNDAVESRLSRLEMNIFNSASPEDTVDDRVERLSAVIAARPTEELYKDMSSLRQYQTTTTQISAAAILLLLIQGLLF